MVKIPIPVTTKEERDKRFSDMYEENKRYINNFGNWYPAIKNAIDKQDVFRAPKSKWFTLSLDWVRWLSSDVYSAEKIKEFNDYLVKEIGDFIELGKTYFIKTGSFSNKFDFSKCKVIDFDQIGAQFLDIFYAGMCVGAGINSEFVIREYVESESQTTIYNGMPLRTEIRFFYDFDNKKMIGYSQYWHEKEMLGLVSWNDTLLQLTTGALASTENMFKIMHNLDKIESHKRVMITDYLTWYYFNEKGSELSNSEFIELTNNLSSLLESANLQSKWSVDVMIENGVPYIIDLATMDRSALTEYMIGFDS